MIDVKAILVALDAKGFYAVSTGGGCSALIKPRGDGRTVLVTGGDEDEATQIPGLGDTVIVVGLHNDDLDVSIDADECTDTDAALAAIDAFMGRK